MRKRRTAIEPTAGVAPRRPQGVTADGRTQRSHDSQRRIVAAMLALIAEGNTTPSADQVAARAQVGLRSVFRHFKDMDSLYREMSTVLAQSIADIVRKPFASDDWRGRVLELVDRRAAAFERLGPYLRAARIHRHRSADLKRGHARFVGNLRQILLDLLPPATSRSRKLTGALELLLSFEAWQRLRDEQDMTIGEAKATLKAAIAAILECHSNTRRPR